MRVLDAYAKQAKKEVSADEKANDNTAYKKKA